jgi:hypothetical protein
MTGNMIYIIYFEKYVYFVKQNRCRKQRKVYCSNLPRILIQVLQLEGARNLTYERIVI